jgi:CelD/BcsL family acetyltransferase involved in cellulose biosynthesis
VETYELISTPAALWRLESDWEDLCRRVPEHYLSQSFAWTRISWELIAAPRGYRLHCVIARDKAKVRLVWPFVAYRRGVWSVLRPLGSETIEYTEPLVDSSERAEPLILKAWRLLCATSKCDVVLLPHVHTESKLYRVVRDFSGLKLIHVVDAPCVNWTGIEEWQDYYKSISRKTRTNLNQRRRRLAELGKVTFETITGVERCAPVIDWMLQHKRAWLQRKGKISEPLWSADYEAWLKASMNISSLVGSRRITVLKLDDRIIAARLSNVDQVRVEGFMTTYDYDFARYSPGEILKEYCLRNAFTQRLCCDFHGGNEPWKRIWSNRYPQDISYTYANTCWGKTYVLATQAGLGLARHIAAQKKSQIKKVISNLLERL